MVLKNKILRSRKLNTEQTQVVMQFNKSKGTMSMKDVNNMINALHKKGKKKHGYFDLKLIRVMNGDKFIHVHGKGGTFYSIDELEEYYEGKVKDTTKFLDFSQIQLTYVYE